MPASSSTSNSSAPKPRPATTSLTTTSQTTTGPRASAWRRLSSDASARTSPPRRSISTDESTAIIEKGPGGSGIDRVARCASAQLAHDVVGAHARRQLEPPAQARNGVFDVLAQDDGATVELDLELAALGEAQGVADGLGKGDLASLGNGRFHDGGFPSRYV